MRVSEIENPTNPSFLGNAAPVEKENNTVCTEVIGKVPEELAGSFVRIGSNPVFVDNPETYHPFDGDGMIHEVHFQNGTASYVNAFVNTKGLQLEREKGDYIWTGLASPPDFNNEHGMMKNVANTAMVFHAGKFLALWEGGNPHHVSLPNLETVAEIDYDGKLNHPFTAHPKVDAQTGEMVTFGASIMASPFCSVSLVDKNGDLVHTTGIDMPKAAMMHDCAITDKHTIFLDLPITFDFTRAMNGQKMLDWEPENGSRIGVVPRMGSDEDIKWFEIDNCMVFHVANAWEEGDEVVLLACRANKTEVGDATENANDADMDMTDQLALFTEWRMNMATGEVTERNLDPVNYGEFPRINDNLAGRKTRYTYVAGIDQNQRGTPFNREMKYDGETGEIQVHPLGEGCKGGEAIFAPRVGAVDEDDGYVILFVRDEINQTSECRVIDAKNFEAEPVARVKIPYRVPFGFHASWVAK